MSSHHCDAWMGEKRVSVMTGWDVPLQGFFLVVEDLEDTESDDYVYSNLQDRALKAWMGLPPKMDHFVAKLKELGIVVPARMLVEVEADQRGNVSDRRVIYRDDGAMKESGQAGR